MKSYIFVIVLGISCFSFGQKVNVDLKRELHQILQRDQGFRELSGGGISEERRQELFEELSITEKEFSENERFLFKQNDSLNLVQIEGIIKKYGYPGKTMVGEPENEAAWFVIQHSDKIETYFPLIKKAGLDGELSMTKVAMMEDRMLMHRGEPQVYGTQAKAIFKVKNPSRQEDVYYIVWPIQNPESVNDRRKTIGFQSTIEDYAKKLGIEYKVFTIQEVEKLLPK